MDYVYNLVKKNDDGTPDIFSFDSKIFDQIDNAKSVNHILTHRDAKRIDLLFYEYYQTNQYDKFVLWYNNIPSAYHLTPGLIITLPDIKDLIKIHSRSWYM